jgi:AcrR family transcriptional regulator
VSARVIDKQEKKDQIISAAMREFVKKGFAKTTISDIAKAAGIGKGTVYEYFSTKEEIIHFTFEHFVRALELDFEEALISNLSPIEKINQIFDGFAGFLDSHSTEMMELMFDFWSESIRNKGDSKNIILQEMQKFYRAYREIFADIIIEGMSTGDFRKDINPKSASSMIVGALDGIMVQWILDRENFDFKDVVNTIKLTMRRGISPEK